MALGTLEIGVAADTRRAERNLENLEGQARETASAGDGVSSSLSKLKSMGGAAMAAGAVAGVAAIGTAAVKATQGVSRLMTMTGQYATEMQNAADRMGIGVEATQEMRHVASQTGTEIDDLQGSMNEMSIRATEAAEGEGEAAGAFQELGVEIENADGSMRDIDSIMQDTVGELGKMENATERAAMADRVLGGEAEKLGPLFEAGAEGMAEMRQEAHDLGLVMSEEATANANEMNLAIGKLQESVKGSARSFAADFSPAVTELVGVGLEAVKLFNDMTEGLSVTEGQAESFVRRGVMTVLDGLQGMLRSLVENLEGLSEWTGAIATGIQVLGTIRTAVTNVQKAMRTWLMFLGQLITRGLEGLVTGIEMAIGAFGDLAQAAADADIHIPGAQSAADALQTAEDSVGSLADGFGDASDFMSDQVMSNIEEIKDDMTDIVPPDYEDQFDRMIEGARRGAETTQEFLDRLQDRVDASDLDVDVSAELGGGDTDDDDDDDDDEGAGSGAEGGDDAMTFTPEEVGAFNRQRDLEEMEAGRGGAANDDQISLLPGSDFMENAFGDIESGANDVEESTSDASSAAQDMSDSVGKLGSNLKGAVGEAETLATSIADVAGASDETQSKISAGAGAAQGGIGLGVGIATGNPMAAIGGGVGLVTSMIELFSDEEEEESSSSRGSSRSQKDFANMLAERIVDEQEERLGRPVEVSVDARGALVGEENEVARTLGDLVSDDLNSRI